MDFIQKNLYAIVVTGVTSIATVVLLVLLWTSTKNVQALDKRVIEIQASEDKFLKLNYRLDERNVKIAQDGAKQAEAANHEFLRSVAARFNAIKPDVEGKSPLAFKGELLQRCDSINQTMKVNNINTNLGTFGFEYFTQPEVIPTKAQMQSILKQLAIDEELVEILSQAQVRTLNNLRLRSGDIKSLKMADKPRFGYFEYDLEVAGDVDTLQRLLKGLYSSRYCFAVRFLTLEAAADIIPGSGATRTTSPAKSASGPMSGGPSGSSTYGGGVPPAATTAAETVETARVRPSEQLTKDERLVVNDLNTLRMTLVVDYIEFKAE